MGRVVMVGDVHGCSDELKRLLDKVNLGPKDELYLLGDMLSRGPDAKGVLSTVKETGARGVRGNHDEALIEWRVALRDAGISPREAIADDRSLEATNKRLSKSQRRLVEQLDDADYDWLESLPVWLDLPKNEVRLVHAGVVPGVAIEEQPKKVLMTMRYLGPGGEPIEKGGSVLWGTLYVGPPHVVFGHNAQPDLQLHPWATGIDTAAVYGGRLTALVLDDDERVPPIADRKERLVSVPSHARYYQP